MMSILRGIALLLIMTALVSAARSPNRSIQMLNDSGSKIDVYWIHPTTKERKIMSSNPVMFGATFPLQTYVGHEFEMRELPSDKTGTCHSADQTCRQATFKISENDDQGKFRCAGFRVFCITLFVIYY